MANNYSQGLYTVLNPEKYVGKGSTKYRSGWELTFMRFCDNHPSVVSWASECVRIPYKNPFTGKDTYYVPDFLVTYQVNGVRKAELIEIKPKKQCVEPKVQKRKTRGYVYEVCEYAKNQAKWKAAKEFCEDRQWEFKVLTEDELGIR